MCSPLGVAFPFRPPSSLLCVLLLLTHLLILTECLDTLSKSKAWTFSLIKRPSSLVIPSINLITAEDLELYLVFYLKWSIHKCPSTASMPPPSSLPSKHSPAVFLPCFLLDTRCYWLCTLPGLIIVLSTSLHLDGASTASPVSYLLSTMWMTSSYFPFNSLLLWDFPQPCFSWRVRII